MRRAQVVDGKDASKVNQSRDADGKISKVKRERRWREVGRNGRRECVPATRTPVRLAVRAHHPSVNAVLCDELACAHCKVAVEVAVVQLDDGKVVDDPDGSRPSKHAPVASREREIQRKTDTDTQTRRVLALTTVRVSRHSCPPVAP